MIATFRLIATATLLLAACQLAGAENWTRFRGPNGQGISSETNLPVRWSATAQVLWKTKIPGVGWSSECLQIKRGAGCC